MIPKDNFKTMQQIDKLHALNGRLIDAMNEGLMTAKETKELISINAERIKSLKKKLK